MTCSFFCLLILSKATLLSSVPYRCILCVNHWGLLSVLKTHSSIIICKLYVICGRSWDEFLKGPKALYHLLVLFLWRCGVGGEPESIMAGGREVDGGDGWFLPCLACARAAPAACDSTSILRKKRIWRGQVIIYSLKKIQKWQLLWGGLDHNLIYLFFHKLSAFDLLCAVLEKRKISSWPQELSVH